MTVTGRVTTERRRGRLTLWRRGGRCYPSTRAQGIDTMARLALQLFGGFRARLEPGGPLRLPTRKAEALLAYLAVPLGQPHPRDKLASLLWGDLSESQARASLRQTLFRLRRAIGASRRHVPSARRRRRRRSCRPRSWWTWRRSSRRSPSRLRRDWSRRRPCTRGTCSPASRWPSRPSRTGCSPSANACAS